MGCPCGNATNARQSKTTNAGPIAPRGKDRGRYWEGPRPAAEKSKTKK